MNNLPIISAFVGSGVTLLAIIVALFRDEIRRLWQRPALIATLKPGSPDGHKTRIDILYNSGTHRTQSSGECYYLRLWIENKGNISPLTGRKPLAFRRRLQQACVGVFQGIAKPPPQAGFFDDTGNHVAIAGMSSYALRGRRHQSASADEHKTRRLQSAVV